MATNELTIRVDQESLDELRSLVERFEAAAQVLSECGVLPGAGNTTTPDNGLAQHIINTPFRPEQ